MGKGKEILVELNRIFHIITDWLLIVLGLGLGVVAWRAVDVDPVKYALIGVGIFLIAVGGWSRHRRVAGERKSKSGR